MSKKFTTKALRLRARAKRRTHSLKVNPVVLSRKPDIREQNLDVIRSIEAKIKG